MVQRTKRSLTAAEAANMQRELRAFHQKVRHWCGEVTIGSTVYVALEILNNDLIVTDGQLTATIHNATYERPPGRNGLT